MTLSPGTRFGSYEIVEPIGKGGMGEVYRATDTRLDRDVAIKTLPAALAGEADRLARFEREAKLLAALSHPHIASIYGLDEHEGTRYLAMELVDGETLEDKLEKGSLPVEETLRIALQIAEALEAAHEKGVVHRDLKPANIMLTRSGEVKVLDFGLAKAFGGDPNEASPAHSPALSLAMTQQGLILGTASYMSPEQASGQATDQRADVWAFGVVLYEMLTGLPLFSGESVPHILAAVLQIEPDWSRLPRNLHPRLTMMLERCLEKKPRNRYHSIADARVDIEKVLTDPQGAISERAQATAATAPARSLTARVASAATLIIAGGLIAGLVAMSLWPEPEPRPVRRFTYTPSAGEELRGAIVGEFALSPDGERLVYIRADGEFFLRELAEREARPLFGSAGTRGSPFFSPDGESIGYFGNAGSEDSIFRIATTGSVPVVIGDGLNLPPLGASWLPDGTIYFADTRGIFRIPAAGGMAESVVAAGDGHVHSSPTLLPDGDSLLFGTSPPGAWDSGQIVVQSLTTGERTVLLDGGNDPRYVPTGHIVYALDNVLFGVAFDIDALSVSGGAVPLVQGVQRAPVTASANYGIAADGTLAYVAASSETGSGTRTLISFDRGGADTILLEDLREYEQPRLSPDGTRLAYSANERRDSADVWIYDMARRITTRLTFDAAQDSYPVWAPDGLSVVFWSGRDGGGIFRQAADGTGQAERLSDPPDQGSQIPTAFSPDGNELVFYSQGTGAPSDLFALSLDGEREVRLLVGTEFDEDFSDLSPNGRWLAYSSDESGNGSDQVYVRPFPNVDDGKWQVSTDYGIDPVFSADGAELYFLSREGLMVARFEEDPTFVPEEPELLFRVRRTALTGRASFDVTPDGQRFVMYVSGDGESAGQIVIVENWVEELKARVPTP